MTLPHVSTNLLSGLMEAVATAPYNGKADLPPLAASLQLEIDDLLPIAETLQLLRLAELAEGDMRLAPAGKRFAEGGTDERKRLFKQQLVTYVPLASHIRAPGARFRDELEDHMSDETAEQTVKAVTSWARYAELLAYDEKADLFTLENPI